MLIIRRRHLVTRPDSWPQRRASGCGCAEAQREHEGGNADPARGDNEGDHGHDQCEGQAQAVGVEGIGHRSTDQEARAQEAGKSLRCAARRDHDSTGSASPDVVGELDRVIADEDTEYGGGAETRREQRRATDGYQPTDGAAHSGGHARRRPRGAHLGELAIVEPLKSEFPGPPVVSRISEQFDDLPEVAELCRVGC